MKIIEAKRAFWSSGVMIKPGETVDLPDTFADELVRSDKATVVQARKGSHLDQRQKARDGQRA